MKRIVLFMFACVSLFVFSACGAEDTSLSDVNRSGFYTVGFFDDCEPFSMFDENGGVSGFDADVNREIAKRLGVELKAVKADKDTIGGMIATNRVDCSANNLLLSRKSKDLKPTKCIFDYKTVVAIRGDSGFSKVTDFSDKCIGFVSGGASENEFDANSALDTTAVPAGYVTEDDAMKALRACEIDGMITSDIYVDYCNRRGDNVKTLEKPLKKEMYTSVFSRKDRALINRVGEIISDMKDDGTIAKIAQKWFGNEYSG